MPSQSLYEKYRPKNWAAVIGQSKAIRGSYRIVATISEQCCKLLKPAKCWNEPFYKKQQGFNFSG